MVEVLCRLRIVMDFAECWGFLFGKRLALVGVGISFKAL